MGFMSGSSDCETDSGKKIALVDTAAVDLCGPFGHGRESGLGAGTQKVLKIMGRTSRSSGLVAIMFVVLALINAGGRHAGPG